MCCTYYKKNRWQHIYRIMPIFLTVCVCFRVYIRNKRLDADIWKPWLLSFCSRFAGNLIFFFVFFRFSQLSLIMTMCALTIQIGFFSEKSQNTDDKLGKIFTTGQTDIHSSIHRVSKVNFKRLLNIRWAHKTGSGPWGRYGGSKTIFFSSRVL